LPIEALSDTIFAILSPRKFSAEIFIPGNNLPETSLYLIGKGGVEGFLDGLPTTAIFRLAEKLCLGKRLCKQMKP